MRVSFGKECIGCGACVSECPEVFELDRNTHCVRLNFSADVDRYAKQIHDAEDVCPVQNIKVYE